MRRWVWAAVLGLVVGCGVAALMAWSVPMTLGWWTGGSFVTFTMLMCLGPEERSIPWPALLSRSLLWPSAALAAAGLVLALGLTSALLVMTAGLASAWELGWLGWPPRTDRLPKSRHRFTGRRSRAGPVAGPVAEAVGPQAVDPVEAVLAVTDGLTDTDLCRAWRSSYVALDRVTDLRAKLRAVEIREVLLDELERRDARGLEAWFRSGARAAGGPERFLRRAAPGGDEARTEPQA
ncbi:hypothetical protein SAMN05428985_104419 [Nocardioides sp. YR527]|uniref:hypothetical protein n=1 Tax=Nocardioides sp. YR527 TaxID=1881028 RepID=UPI000887116D|nr:hypothetical protein [Nocardioides sp. YR527]SDK53979.1 hypothetical protein SAMN05428985_104419 [Nocardioides sp. YR527]